jgi:hypothetical protein
MYLVGAAGIFGHVEKHADDMWVRRLEKRCGGLDTRTAGENWSWEWRLIRAARVRSVQQSPSTG